MKRSLRVKLLWGHVLLFLASSTISILITWMEFEQDGTAFRASATHWRPVLIAAGISCAPVLLLSIASWWFTRLCLTPICKLTEVAERIQEGSLHERIPTTGANDELDRLATVLNAMIERMDASFQKIREFTLHASHELKTPLTILMAGFEEALSERQITERQRERLLKWLDELERLNQIVSGLTLLTQGEAHQVDLNLETVDLTELVAESADEAEILGQSLALKVTVQRPESSLILADRHRVRQLLLNITDNAVKYNRQNGHIEYRVELEGDQVRVDIRSGGRGIGAEELPHIFDRFFRSSTSRGTVSVGCGLGLSIARWIAEEHGGSLTASSAPDNTVLTLRLPLEPTQKQPPVSARFVPAVAALVALSVSSAVAAADSGDGMCHDQVDRPVLVERAQHVCRFYTQSPLLP
jgi:signal transduction histidine kinase